MYYSCWLDALLRLDGKINLLLTVTLEGEMIWSISNESVEKDDPLLQLLSRAALDLSMDKENLREMVDLPDDCEIDVTILPYTVSGAFGWRMYADAYQYEKVES